jgi:DNA repair photolyase
MRWQTQLLDGSPAADQSAPPQPLIKLSSLVRSVSTPEFDGITFHEVVAKTALNHVPVTSRMLPGAWTVNPYRGCSHACVYCYARNTHRYIDLDTGADFDSQIVVKVNVAEVLARELTTMRELPERVALGTNTDPYQRAEGRYRLMPGIIEALAARQVPFSILTKGTLLRRDLSLLADVNATCPVSLAMSIAVFDDELQQSLEPGTPSTAARLATVGQIRDLGMDCAVFLAPIVPGLTDTIEHLDRALEQIKAAGGTSIFYTALRLGADVKEWYVTWLARDHPELVGRYQELYGGSSSVPQTYRRSLDARMQVLLRRHGLPGGADGSPDANRAAAEKFSLDRSASRAAASVRAGVAAERPKGQPQLF